MKKFSLLIMPLMAVSFLASCNNGGNTPVQTFTVVWQNDDGTVLETDYKVPYGSKPKYDGPTPTKPDTEKYQYTFVGWDKDITKDIIEDTTFTATYTAKAFKHIVTFYDSDKTTVLDKHEVEHGVTPQYKGAYPVRVDDSYYYTFDGWDRELEPITTDTSYYAKPRRPIPIEGISAYIKLVIPESSTDRKFDFTYTTEGGTDIEVSWGDDTNTNGTSSHTYAEPGIYDVTIKNATMIDT